MKVANKAKKVSGELLTSERELWEKEYGEGVKRAPNKA